MFVKSRIVLTQKSTSPLRQVIKNIWFASFIQPTTCCIDYCKTQNEIIQRVQILRDIKRSWRARDILNLTLIAAKCYIDDYIVLDATAASQWKTLLHEEVEVSI